MALWTPAVITTDLWLDASDGSTITIATGVSQWADKSGNNRHANQVTGAAQPTIAAAWLNGLNALNFNGSSQFLSCGDVLDLASGGLTAICVAQTNTPGSTNGVIYAKSIAGAAAGRYHLGWLLSANNLSVSFTFDTTAGIAASIATTSTAANICGQMINREGLEKVLLNGLSAQATFTANTSNLNTTTRFLVGGYSNANDTGLYVYHAGRICEIVLVRQALSTNDIQTIEGYLAWKWGLQANLPVDHPYKSAAPTIPDTTVLVQSLSQPYALEGSPRALLAQDWNLMMSLRAVIDQNWSLRMMQILTQHYGDVPVVRQLLEQYWGPAAMLRRLVAQPYSDALRLRQGLDQEWILNAGLLAMMEQRYSIAGDQYIAMAEQAYNLNEYAILKQQLDQIYLMSPDAEEAQEPLFSITTNGGDILKPHHINIEIDEGEYAIKGEIHLASQEDFIFCKHLETEIIIPIDSTEYHLLVEGPRQSRPEWGRIEYYIPLASKTILLDSPYATPIDQEFTGALASAIVADLAAIESITVVWQLIDWYIPTGVLTANNESPLSIIRRIVNAVGGILQSSPAGELICLPEYPTSTTGWETATPDFYLTDMDNFFSVDSVSDIREGYNRFLISDKVIDESGLTLEQVDIDENTKDIYVYQVPWNPLEQVILHTSGGAWVSIVAEGITTEEITEIVEIIAGEGMTQKPFYSKVSHDYKETDLGVITINEDKTVSTATKQNSLVEVVYNTKYWKFRVRDAEIEKVQFFPEAITI